MARFGGSPEERKTIGIVIDDPVVGLLGLARSLRTQAEGPTDRAEHLQSVLSGTKLEVVADRRVALVDMYVQTL